ncbi:rhamnulose-1-phosphate aldolase/alcohol dehydrogenase [Owenweeksia hongkongensis DSM 17368]|uniref:Rhamnulose-1-phosphate aldolase/alcohol dehydrogenase n=1 Tax=Owenweeksia hongkongensis (strain DSM 17368 / CIP 108786 / JCM 12287 / NRRL B-23963 / UST20020801) TaxID=926562 RepID=G8R314_OWEHD|nr:bifunctional rhamnulose-1-phosphate aldolase/short-chain dehydrogenase [Owenweeksia hongkongensis]AEV33008.1 rhamnulose-1-phosphate aldolase/alcohol dehydrogenase [Owenweeksia hongkongensis DSM 17368]
MDVDTSYKHVDYLWDEKKAAELKGDEVALLLYRSNILGADLRITNYGGGNTSCKTIEKDPLTNQEKEIMWVKGSGGDIGTLTRSGLAGLYVDKLRALENVYRGIEFEDEMVALFNHCIYDLDSKAPSIDTPLHAFLPYKHIDHLHPDAIIAIAASKDGEQITKDLFNGELAWIPWQRPGFDLALQLRDALNANPGIRGIILGGHGLFTWGDTAYDCYINSLSVIDRASEYLENNYGTKRSVFGGVKINSLDEGMRKSQAAKLAPVLRGLASSEAAMIGHFTDDMRVLEFINSNDLEKLAPMGTSCPDHFLRTKIRPLVLDFLPADSDVSDFAAMREKLATAFEDYRAYYTKYYEDHKHPNSPALRDPNPVIILWPGVGMFSFAKNKQTTRVASEFYINAINVMKGAEAVSEYVSLPLQEAFDIEYWLLEEAKLQRMPKEKPLSRKVALITGSAGGIGKAIADKMAEEGACVVLTDISKERLEEAVKDFGKDEAVQTELDVTSDASIANAFDQAALAFGGVDIVVNCAGLAISKPLNETTDKDWDLLQNVIVKGQFKVSQAGASVLKGQKMGGFIVNIASKNGLVSGPNNVGYGTAKAAQIHMSRLLAAELGPDKIRVNVVNPDAVIEGSKIWEGEWAAGRAKAYGISVEELPAHYAKRTLLNEIISTEDIANGVFAFVGGHLSKSTGNILNVDGGVAAAFTR